MELEVAITLMIGLSFLAIIGAKVSRNYFDTETIIHKDDTKHQLETNKLMIELETLNNSNRNYVYKIRKMRENYDLDYDDIGIDEDEEFKLSDLATSIYPKLPPSLAKLIDKEEFQNAVVKTVEKSPEILNVFVDKFLNKKSERSTSNTSVLQETYI